MKILIAVDFSEITKAVMEVVRRLPAGEDTRFYLLHVAEPDPDFVGWDAGPDVVRDQVAREFGREHRELKEHADRLRAGGRHVTALLVQGPTVDTVMREAKKLEADLLVVGSHGHGAAYNLLVGSISSGIIQHSPLPVLVVPDPRTAGGSERDVEARSRPARRG